MFVSEMMLRDALCAFRMKLRNPQHNLGIITHYLSVVYYYGVGTSFEAGTRGSHEEMSAPRPTLKPQESTN